jgi:transposase InsO family protein
MQIHSNATTNINQRRFFGQSPESCKRLSGACHVSPATVCKWKGRDDQQDRSSRPKTIHYAFSPDEEKIILALRKKGLALDALTRAVVKVLPDAKRSSIHRLLVRKEVNVLPQYQKEKRERPGRFKDYLPGYIHIDCFYLPKMGGKREYCFVAIDRATRLAFLRVYDNLTKESAVNFLGLCLWFYPFMIHKILTDNGLEFTLANYRNRWGTPAKKPHFFDEVCAACGIEHRLTRPYTPKTNGLVERMNGLIQEGTCKTFKYPGYPELLAGLDQWLVIYNLRREHSAIGGKTPYEKVCDWYAQRPDLFIKEPTYLLNFRSQRGGT